jgi:adenine-specific DNA-methyltransferase
LSKFKEQLSARDQAETGVRYEWYCLARPRPEGAQFFGTPKIVFPDIAPESSFAWDASGHIIENTAYMVPGHKWLLGVLNSPAVFWFCTQISNTIRGGFVRFIRQYVEQIPIPSATPEQQRSCELLAEALTLLHNRGESGRVEGAPFSLMAAYFEQWLNGLVYELFFTEELHAHHLHLFDETAKLAPPDLSRLGERDRLDRLQEVFAKAYDINAPLRAMLFSLASVESVRVIEGESQPA